MTIHRKLGARGRRRPPRGIRVEQTLCLHHANFKVKWRLAECEEPRHAVWEGRGPAGSHARTVDDLTPLDGGRATRFDYRNEYSNPGGFLGRIAGRVLVGGVAEREARQSLQRLKALVERRPSGHRSRTDAARLSARARRVPKAVAGRHRGGPSTPRSRCNG